MSNAFSSPPDELGNNNASVIMRKIEDIAVLVFDLPEDLLVECVRQQDRVWGDLARDVAVDGLDHTVQSDDQHVDQCNSARVARLKGEFNIVGAAHDAEQLARHVGWYEINCGRVRDYAARDFKVHFPPHSLDADPS